MSKELGVIVPYFGPLPETFSAWVKSLEISENIQYFLVTDQDVPLYHVSNLRIVNMSFESVQRRVKETIDVNLHSPYKLCDLKPAYGYIFSELLSGFTYWAYCDLDLVFGDIKEVLEQVKKDKIHKVFSKGHFSIYQNTTEINELFQVNRHNNKWHYIKNSKVIWVFDESYYGDIIGINGLVLNEGKKLLEDVSIYADVDPKKKGFFNMNREGESCFFCLKKDCLVEVSYDPKSDLFQEKVIVYAHYQKRRVRMTNARDGVLLIYPHHWEDVYSVSEGKLLLKKNIALDTEDKENMFLTRTRKKIIKAINLLSELPRIELISIIYMKLKRISFSKITS
jgi:hypothetical protein